VNSGLRASGFGLRPAIAAILIAACGHAAAPTTGPVHVATPTPDARPIDAAPAVTDIWAAPPAPSAEPAWSPPTPTIFTLASGVRVVLVENHRLPLVSLRVIEHRAGAREDGAAPGLAALTAALLEEGAGTWTATTFPEQLDRLGATLDASAGADDVVVAVDTLRESLEPSIALTADVLLRPRFTAADVARVKGDRLADLRRRPDEPRLVAGLVFERLIFGAHPYAQPTDGYVASVEKLGPAEVRAFWRDHYGPHATTIVVAGDIDRATLEPLLAAQFGAWTGGPTDAQPPAPAAAVAHPPVLAVVDRPGAPQSVVIIGRLGPPGGDPDWAPHEVGNTALGGSFSSRLNHSLREVHGWTYDVGSGFWHGRTAGAWQMETSLQTPDTAAGITEALAIIEQTRTAPLADDELARTRLLLTRSLPQEFETNAGIASAFERVESLGMPDDWYQGWAAKVRAVTAAETRASAADAWSDLTIIVVGDWKKVGPELAKLGVPIVQVDGEGNPIKRKSK
jgi:predicted Zn-dependent peptidase